MEEAVPAQLRLTGSARSASNKAVIIRCPVHRPPVDMREHVEGEAT